MAARVLALVDDLFFVSKILETAKHAGVEFKAAATPDVLLALMKDGAPALVIVDLNARQGGGIAAVEGLRASGFSGPVIGFLSHVQVELAEQAKTAGCSQVLPRSQFTQNLAQILGMAKDGRTENSGS